jgi:aminopeptidase N
MYLNSSNNMTDRLAALMALVNTGSKTAQQPLNRIYRDFKNEALVVDKWFSLQAVAMHTDVNAVRKLMTHPAFTLKNPNRARQPDLQFLQRQSVTVPCSGWQRLCLLGGTSDRAKQA